MYLRFQYRLKRSKRQPSLVVLESRRIDGKSPRQRLVKYVGSIRRDDVHRVAGRHRFWTRADQRLSDFAPEDRARFVTALEALVSRPTAEELAVLLQPEAVRRAEAINAARARMAASKIARAGTGTSG